ncbi:RHS repeat-associated core domain-containing protein [Pseudomonas sp. Irchel s3h17]|uniref:RHS repeat-associated core domain-containing protein n=1 Tax=Pseudomonas sp. Irchel s3h17 TaxID=2009182 RepID=UPI00155E9EB3|nr:RHS repeat-associated core domain-containing protein [Pseudomonas sp. Irchel s3h17]
MSSSSPIDQQNPCWQRTVLLASDNSQSIIAEVTNGKTNAIAYSAYGEQSAQQDVVTRLGFNGQLRELQIGWYLLGNGYRAYNPRLMRFHSPDSWSPFGSGGLNPYMYCVGDPVNRSDPTGHAFKFSNWFHLPGYRADPSPIKVNFRSAANAARSLQQSRTFESSNDLSAILGVGIDLVRPRVRVRMIGDYPSKGDDSTHGMKWGTTPSNVPLTTWRVSPSSQGSHSAVAHRQAASSTGRPTRSGSLPSFAEATSGSGMKHWNADTFAASQTPANYVVNHMAISSPYENLTLALPHPTPPPAQQVQQGNFGINVAALRAAPQNQARGTANLADVQQVLRERR